MKKEELIERIIDTLTYMGSESPEDTAACDDLTLEDARIYLAEYRGMEKEDMEPDEWLPEEVTPQLYMIANNCYIHKCRYDVTVERLAEHFILGELVDTYHEYDGAYISYTDKIVYPTDFLREDMEFPFTCDDLTMLDLITLGQNSPDFDPNKKFCWYNVTDNKLISTDTPFKEGLINAKAFAEWILEKPERVQYFQEMYLLNTDIDYIFRYWR